MSTVLLPVDLADVMLWGTRIGAVAWQRENGFATFEYDRSFLNSGIEIAPLHMPLASRPYRFATLPKPTFHGLPGLLADTLPDRFGNLLINRWLADQGRSGEDFSPVERLCYQGSRGMGALEFKPALGSGREISAEVDVAGLVGLANQVLAEREGLSIDSSAPGSFADIIRVGTSAGGARAKAVIALDESTGEMRSGQITPEHDQGGTAPNRRRFTQWLLKFDGVTGNRDKELADPQGYGVIEFAYYRMALAAGIQMETCKLHREGGRSHFMTRRFDRPGTGGEKLHMLSLCGMAHFDFNSAGAHSYEQAIQTIRKLDLPRVDVLEQFRRAVFNVLARNQDDHTKNIAFLMDRTGCWRLSPAYDVTYSYNPTGKWTGQHQMSVAGKRDGFDLDDLRSLSRAGNLGLGEFRNIVAEVTEAIAGWTEFAAEAGVPEEDAAKIAKTHRVMTRQS